MTTSRGRVRAQAYKQSTVMNQAWRPCPGVFLPVDRVVERADQRRGLRTGRIAGVDPRRQFSAQIEAFSAVAKVTQAA